MRSWPAPRGLPHAQRHAQRGSGAALYLGNGVSATVTDSVFSFAPPSQTREAKDVRQAPAVACSRLAPSTCPVPPFPAGASPPHLLLPLPSPSAIERGALAPRAAQALYANSRATLTLSNLTFAGAAPPARFVYCKMAHDGAEFNTTARAVLKC